MPKEESFPFPMKYTAVTRTTHTSLDVLMEKHLEDYWNVDGERKLSDAWTGFTRFVLLKERPPEGYTWSGAIPGFVIQKNSSRGPKHGVSERQVMFYKAKQMLQKARQCKHGSHPTILSRWSEQQGYRKSLTEHNIGEKEALRS